MDVNHDDILVLLGMLVTLIGYWNNRKIAELHAHINSRMTELLEATKKVGHAEGMKDQREYDRRKEITSEPLD